MRALVRDPALISPGRYRRFVRQAELRGMLADHLYHGEPYLALNALVLDRSEGEQLLPALSETFASAFHKAGQLLAKDVPQLIEMGFPWAAAELLAAEVPKVPVAGRFDYVRDGSGVWWLLEFNADTPSGIREAIVADELVQRLLPQACALARPNAHLAADLVSAFCRALSGTFPRPALGLVTDAGELEDLAQMAFTAELLRAALATHGIEVVLGDVRNLHRSRGGLALCGTPIGSLYRYVALESMFGTTAFADLFDAAASGQVRLLNGLYGLLLQHKGLMAWIWSHRDDSMFTDEERAAIHGHLPPTWPVSCLPRGVPYTDLVLKQVFGREGEEVFFGDALSPADIAELGRRGTYIGQQRIDTPPVEAVVQSALGPELQRGYVTLGSYVTDGHWAGYYSRLGQRIVTAQAKWLATFVETRTPPHPRRRPAFD